MKILVTGSNGFIGKNLISNLSLRDDIQIYRYNRDSSYDDLLSYTKDCDFVYHLAGINRSDNIDDFYNGNVLLLSKIFECLKTNNNKCSVLITSSSHANLDTQYGKSKKQEEELAFSYAKENNVKIYVYRLNNLFGKWCKPNYNGVIATWCYNISHNLDIVVNDRNTILSLNYIDDVCNDFIKCLSNSIECFDDGFYYVNNVYKKSLGEIVDLIFSFKKNELDILVPTTGDEFIKKLYSTYLSYVPLNDLVVDMESHKDDRGVFCELVRTRDSGQISVSKTNPKVLRGGHYHNTKMERFIVISGEAKITFEHVIDHSKYEFYVSGDRLQYVNIPVGYQHRIDNIGDSELIMILWANELFDTNSPDTYVMKG